MARLIVYLVAGVAVLVVAWIVFSAILHTLMVGFWIVLALLLCVGLFRIGRWSRRGSPE